jgi:hypothetical protein
VPRLHDTGTLAVHFDDQPLIPVSGGVGLRVTVAGDVVRLSWHDRRPSTASGFFHVLRTHARSDVYCAGRLNDAADNCTLYTDSVATTRSTSFVDHPGTGAWTYRVGIAANWLDDPKLGDIYIVSKPVTIEVG